MFLSGTTNCIQKKFRIKIKELSNHDPITLFKPTLEYLLLRQELNESQCLSVAVSVCLIGTIWFYALNLYLLFRSVLCLFKLYLSALFAFFVGQTEPKILHLVFNNSGPELDSDANTGW